MKVRSNRLSKLLSKNLQKKEIRTKFLVIKMLKVLKQYDKSGPMAFTILDPPAEVLAFVFVFVM